MKIVLLGFVCLASFSAQALEFIPQIENDQICVTKVKVQSNEEINHRDTYPQIVIALKGGTLTRLEADGRTTELKFPAGEAVLRESDPENELRRSINNSSEPVELVVIELKNSPPTIKNKPENSQDISVNIKINCDTSEEFREFVKSIPPSGSYFSSFDEWKSSFVNNMNYLVRLVESNKIYHSWWSASWRPVNTEGINDPFPAPQVQ